MALIDCPECGGQVSDRAPTCPHCGVPIASSAEARGGAQPEQPSQAAIASASAAAPAAANALDASPYDSVEPFRIRLAGRPLPIAGLLFWGGMVVGIMLKYLVPPSEPEGETEFWRYLPWLMIWLGVLWFAVTEFGALIKHKLNRR
ncbi:MAG: zinc ribbon domain-containing protein [Halochromatium sp.]|uniref:zinc ribbon domain-containing protein n=1 Tax=Halochromatium sp. TaxID=2049430 RepID=UPI00397AA0C9